MNNTTFFTLLFLAVFTFGCGGSKTGESGTDKQQKPNILYIMSDDHAYQAVSSYGHEPQLNKTPNIDRIAEEGAIFTNSFVTNSICAPSRATMLTGKFTHINGQIDNRREFDASQQMFPKILQKNGYQTAIFGKWHLRAKPQGFDYWSVHYGQGNYYNPDMWEMGERKHYEGYSVDIVADNTMEWLKNRDKSKPFCALMHFKAPHRNWMADTSKLTMYEDKEFPLPENFYDDYEDREAAAEQEMSIWKDMHLSWDLKLLGMEGLNEPFQSKLDRMTPEQREKWDDFYNPIIREFKEKNLHGKALAEWKYQRYLRDYLKTISSVDDNIGRVLDYLEENDLAENTIVVYTSDQGFYLGEHGWFDKRWIYEESLRTPLVMKYPQGIEPGRKIDAMVQNVDYAPTFLDYAGVDIPSDIQGKSLKPVLEGEKDKVRDALLYQYFEYPGAHSVKRHYGIRTQRYKLVHFYYDIDDWEFYDLKEDPREMDNLYGEGTHEEIIEEMKSKLDSLQKEYNSDGDTYQRILEDDKKRFDF